VLELTDLTRRYGETVALDGLSLRVPEGEVVGFVGPNGAGKTTAMRIARGVLEPDSGEVLWRGEPATREAQRAFGYMPEERGLYPKMRVDRQLRYIATLHGDDDPGAARAADRWSERLGLGEQTGQRVEELSLGNQQRVQLAAALVHEPDMLILDEPFSGLDPIGTDVMSEVLNDRARDGAAVIFSSHQLELVERLCDSVAIVVDGRIVAAGKVDELRAERPEPRLRIDVEGTADGWADQVPAVKVIARDEQGVRSSFTRAPTTRPCSTRLAAPAGSSASSPRARRWPSCFERPSSYEPAQGGLARRPPRIHRAHPLARVPDRHRHHGRRGRRRGHSCRRDRR
jgi:ABC-2 type transport system ATP-binding protein